jgi:ribosomal protein S18 acetylase RimI-like enzyme
MNRYSLPVGFTVRSATLNDVDIAADLFKTYALAVAGVEDIDAEETRNAWQSPGFDPATDIQMVFSPEGQLAAYVEVWANSKLPVHPFIWACVHPDFMGLGLGTYVTAWGEERCCKVIDILPPDLRVAARAVAYSTNQPAHHLLSQRNWTHIRSFYIMRIDMDSTPPAPGWPAGIDLFPYTSESLRELYTSHREAFQDHFGYVDLPFESGLEQFKHGLENDPQHDPALWFVARDGNEIAGYCLCRTASPSDHDAGYVNVLGVRQAWRKRGLGLALLQHAFCEFHRRGQMHVELGVDAENLTGALRLYEKAGMHVHRQNDVFEKELRPGKEIAVESL